MLDDCSITTIKHKMSSTCVKYLYNNVPELNCQSESLRLTSLHWATYKGKEDFVEALVTTGDDVNAKNKDGLTPLHIAAMFGNSRIVDILISHGAEVNCREMFSLLTPLHFASINGHLKDVKGLVELDEEICRREGIFVADRQLPATLVEGYEAVVKDLVKAGANLNSTDTTGRTALHLAMRHRTKVIRTLLMSGADSEAQDNEGRLPLHEAIKYKNSEGLKALLEFGMDTNDIETIRSIISSKAYSVRFTVFEHATKLKAAKLPIASVYACHIDKHHMQSYFVKCLEEVEKLKTYEIDSGVTLHDLLYMSPRRQSAYTKNKRPPADLQWKFPNYCGIVGAIYSETGRRKKLLEPAKLAWYQLTCVHIPDICVEHILSFLDRQCLKVMIGGPENFR